MLLKLGMASREPGTGAWERDRPENLIRSCK